MIFINALIQGYASVALVFPSPLPHEVTTTTIMWKVLYSGYTIFHFTHPKGLTFFSHINP